MTAVQTIAARAVKVAQVLPPQGVGFFGFISSVPFLGLGCWPHPPNARFRGRLHRESDMNRPLAQTLQCQTLGFKVLGMKRAYAPLLKAYLASFPCVALIGVRLCGKTTMLGTLPPEWKRYDLELSMCCGTRIPAPKDELAHDSSSGCRSRSVKPLPRRMDRRIIASSRRAGNQSRTCVRARVTPV
jgi:hypothetical protein